jgi:hypothetical protein
MRLCLTRRTTVLDEQTGDRFVGPGQFDVDDEQAGRFLDARPGLWERVDEAGGDADVDTDPDADTGADAADARGDLDEGVVDEHWQALAARIRDGEFDSRLDTLESVERGRDGGPRQSILEAIDGRR